MAATVKTLIEHSGELYWGTRQAMPGYHFGLSLNVMENGLVARAVYVMSDLDDSEEPLVTPELLASACFSVDDLVPNGIVPSDLMDEDESEDGPWRRCAPATTSWTATWTSSLPS